MSMRASDETSLAFLQTKSNKWQQVVPDDVRGDEEALRFFLSPCCRLCALCGLCGEKKRRRGGERQNMRCEILSCHPFRVECLLIILL